MADNKLEPLVRLDHDEITFTSMTEWAPIDLSSLDYDLENFVADLNRAAEPWDQAREKKAVQEELGFILRSIADASSRDRMFEIIVKRRQELRGDAPGRSLLAWAEGKEAGS